MTKDELIRKIAVSAGITVTEGTAFFNAFIEAATDELKGGGELLMQGFGRLYAKKRAGRTGRNPRTGAKLDIPACMTASFSAGKALKESLNK